MFAALEVKTGETDHYVIGVFFRHADGMGLKFKKLEPYGRFTLGLLTFLRFETDCQKMDSLIPFLQEEARGVILPMGADYIVHTQTTKGKVRISMMQATKFPGYQRKYRGTADKFWRRQFD